ncbi:hypothetical protein KKE13_02700 [Patescibacteria group bacterium]|nr:hypothetical protein [Patescibacteria group bacterium]
MKTVFICKDGDIGSLLSHFVDAVTAKKAGEDAGLIVAQEALWALATGEFTPRPALEDHINQDVIKGAGFPTDAAGLINLAKEAEVPVKACGGWTAILGLGEKLPDGIEVAEVGPLLLGATKIIGGF